MTSYVGPNDRRVILGGILGIGLMLLLLHYSQTSSWRQITSTDLDDPENKVTQILGYNVLSQVLYVRPQSGEIYGCHDSANFLILAATCQKVDYESASQDLRRSYQCMSRMIFPTPAPPGMPIAQFVSYPCQMGYFQTNHIVLADGSLWRLEQGIPEDSEYWTIGLTIRLGPFFFLVGMIVTAVIIMLGRRMRRLSK